MKSRLLAPLFALSLLAGCAHSGVPFSVVATDTGLGRDFRYEAKEGLLEADGAEGPILRMWMHSREIHTGSTSREIPEGCTGGFLYRHRGVGGKLGRIVVKLCPGQAADGAAAQAIRWRADFEELSKVEVPDTALASAVAFDLVPSSDGASMIVSTETTKVQVALPEKEKAFFRRHPEVLAFALISGIVPASRVGTYQSSEQ